MRIGIVGAGLQGRRRAAAAAAHPETTFVAVTSREPADAAALASGYGAKVVEDWPALVARADLDAVLVCTPPDSHAAITVAALDQGLHVLCEKPLARTLPEAAEMVLRSRLTGRVLWCGWNHRHHPAVAEARRLVLAGEIGRPLFGRGVYGIGARPAYRDEWRADPRVAAGGHLMEQGIHLLDLYRWTVGDAAAVTAMTQRSFVDMGGMEDSAFVLTRTAEGVTVSVHAALTQWRNHFTFEVSGTEGHVLVEGLGGAYGTETLRVGPRDPDGPFAERVLEYRRPDPSWSSEWNAFVHAVRTGAAPDGFTLDGADGLIAMSTADAAYASARTGQVQTAKPIETLLREFGGIHA